MLADAKGDAAGTFIEQLVDMRFLDNGCSAARTVSILQCGVDGERKAHLPHDAVAYDGLSRLRSGETGPASIGKDF